MVTNISRSADDWPVESIGERLNRNMGVVLALLATGICALYLAALPDYAHWCSGREPGAVGCGLFRAAPVIAPTVAVGARGASGSTTIRSSGESTAAWDRLDPNRSDAEFVDRRSMRTLLSGILGLAFLCFGRLFDLSRGQHPLNYRAPKLGGGMTGGIWLESVFTLAVGLMLCFLALELVRPTPPSPAPSAPKTDTLGK